MAKIFAPNKDYTGISAGVGFVKGVGECADPYLISWFKSKGYEVEMDVAELEKEPEEEIPKKKTTRKVTE